MLIKVFNEKDYKTLIELGCKHIRKTFTSSGENVDVMFDLFVPKDKVEEFNKLEVNVIKSNTLTF